MNSTSLPPKIQKFFEKTKPVCFGRFVIDVPAETTVVPGPQDFGPKIETIENGAAKIAKLVQDKKKALESVMHLREPGTLLRESTEGPLPGSWTILFRGDESATRVMKVWGYLRATPHAFLYQGSTAPSEGRTVDTERAALQQIAIHLRARAPDEVPTEPGVCLNLGFIADDSGKYQEIFGVGLRFPSLPDVSLSISSNKDAQTGPSLSDKRKEAERAIQGSGLEAEYRKVKVLREGERPIFQWKGEEALFKRPRKEGGDWHEFQYEYRGIRYDKNNPALEAAMFTGVDRNTAGGKATTLTDAEAMALWDALLSTLRLRVGGK